MRDADGIWASGYTGAEFAWALLLAVPTRAGGDAKRIRRMEYGCSFRESLFGRSLCYSRGTSRSIACARSHSPSKKRGTFSWTSKMAAGYQQQAVRLG